MESLSHRHDRNIKVLILVCDCVYTCMYVCVYVCVGCVCRWVVCVSVCVCVCVRERERERFQPVSIKNQIHVYTLLEV